MREYRLYILALIFVFAGFGQAFSGGSDTVATVAGSHAITFQALQTYVHDRFYDRMYKSKPLEYAYERALQDMVVNQLKRIDFFELGLQNDSELLQRNRRMVNEEVVIRYFEREFLRKYVNDRSIHDAYEQMKHETVVRRFIVDTLASPRGRKQLSLDAIAKKLDAQRAGGKGFDDLVRACGQMLDISNAVMDTEIVSWKVSLSNAADSLKFQLRAGNVGIVRYPAQLEIFKVVRVTKVAVEPFDKVKDDIYNTLRQQFVNPSFDEFSRAKKALVNENGLQWNEKGLESLWRWSDIPGFYPYFYADTLGKAIADGRNAVLLKYRGGNVDLKEYLRWLNDVLMVPERAKMKIADLKIFILEALRTDKMIKKAVALGLDKKVFNPNTTDPDLKDRLVSLYNQKEIDGKVPPLTEERIREFYAANKDTLYYQLAKVNIYAVISSDKRAIDSLWEMHVTKGTPLEKLTGSYYVKGFVKDRYDDTIRSYMSLEPPYLGKAAFTLTLNQVAGPFEYEDPAQGHQYAIIKCAEKRPERQLTLDDARKTIATDYREYEKKRIEIETAERLKSAYGYKIYEDVLRRDLPPAKKD